MGNPLTEAMGNILTEPVGKVLDIYNSPHSAPCSCRAVCALGQSPQVRSCMPMSA